MPCAFAQGPALIQEVISREVGLFMGADPDYRETVSREVALFVGADPEAGQVISREVSLVLADATPPPPIPEVILTLSPRRDTVVLDWSAYNQWEVRDVASYAVYYSNRGFTSTEGMTPSRIVPGETFTTTFTGLPEFEDFFFAVVPIDALGNAVTTVTPTSNYALIREIISREVALFNGHEGAPEYKELVSREVSLLLSDPAPPPQVTNLSITHSPTGRDIALSWEGYNQWETRDVSGYQIFRSGTPFTSISGLTPYATVPGEVFALSFTGEPENADSYWAVVAVDGSGNRNSAVRYKGVYILSPEVISREVALFNGHEPAQPLLREVVSREVSLVVPSLEIPAPVTGIGSGFLVDTSLTEYKAIDLDWTAYDEAAQRDVRLYRIYVGTSFFDNVTGMTPVKTVADGTQRHTLAGLEAEEIYFVAVVAEDVSGGLNPVVYAQSVKASVETLGDVSEVEALPFGTSITCTWDLGGVGTNLQGFVDHFNIYFNGFPAEYAAALQRAWTSPATLTPGVTYSIRITTVDLLGTESPGVTVMATIPSGGPASQESPLSIGRMLVGDTTITLQLQSETGASYAIETSSDLINWAYSGTTVAGDGSVHSVVLPKPGPKAWFRAVITK